jgi:hypothetical protein
MLRIQPVIVVELGRRAEVGGKAPFVSPQRADPERLQLSREKPFRRRSLSSTRHAEYNGRGLGLCKKKSAQNATV